MIFHCKNISYFIHSSVDGHWDYVGSLSLCYWSFYIFFQGILIQICGRRNNGLSKSTSLTCEYIIAWAEETLCACMLTCFSRVWLCDPVDCSSPGSSVHGIFQARILEWVAIPFSRESSQFRGETWVSSVSCTGRQVLYHQLHFTDTIKIRILR